MLVKEAWDIVGVTHEGTSKVKTSRLQLLTKKYENLKMLEDETIYELNVCLVGIVNKTFTLGEKLAKNKIK